MAGHVTIEAVNAGLVDLTDILKINALMDAQDAAEAKPSKGTM
jgi:hypothetical protein